VTSLRVTKFGGIEKMITSNYGRNPHLGGALTAHSTGM
jgi:hypothetical protein